MCNAHEVSAVKAKWLWTGRGARDGDLREDCHVLIDGNRIVEISPHLPPELSDKTLEVPEALVIPGMINAHNHCSTGVMTRALTDDMDTDEFDKDLVYGVEMPLADIATEILSPDDMSALIQLGLLELIRSGTTTLVEMFRPPQSQIFDLAGEMGMRIYGAPYLFSKANLNVAEDGSATYGKPDTEALARWRGLFEKHNGDWEDRVRVILGPHASDTCDASLFRSIRATADELGCLITLHLCQAQTELDKIRSEHGMTPVEFLDSIGLLGPDVIAAHCIHATDSDLEILRRRGVSIANCPRTYARGGTAACFHRFMDAGVPTLIGTDGYRMDITGEMQAAGMVSKLLYGKPNVARAQDLLRAVTAQGARALGRDDLGRIEPGARADLVVADMRALQIAPATDPIRSFVWRASGANISSVMVDGHLTVRDGRFLNGDEDAILHRAAGASKRLWRDPQAREIITRFNHGAA